MVPLTFSPYHGASGGGKGIKLAGQILVERQNVIVPVRRSPSTISKTLVRHSHPIRSTVLRNDFCDKSGAHKHDMKVLVRQDKTKKQQASSTPPHLHEAAHIGVYCDKSHTPL